MPRALPRYALLAALIVAAIYVRGSDMLDLIESLRHGASIPQAPLTLSAATRTIAYGEYAGDQILAMDGKPFNAAQQLAEAIHNHKPGDQMALTLSLPSGLAVERTITIGSQAGEFDNVGKVAINIAGDIVIPVVAIFLGAFAVAIRPFDWNAWLLLGLTVGFSEVVNRSYGVLGPFQAIWNLIWAALWPIFMMLFGIYFPELSRFERSFPWLKWILLLVSLGIEFLFAGIVILWRFDINSALPFRPLLVRMYFLQIVVAMLAVSTYFANISMKSATDPSADSRRRLRILIWGSQISLAPTFLAAIYALARGQGLFTGLPWALDVIALLLLTLFPLTLAYVIVVERAMDLRFVIRQSIQYALARVGLRVGRVALIAIGVYLIVGVMSKKQRGAGEWALVAGSWMGLLLLRRRSADRASQWIDRKFFREAYNAEKVLAELARDVGRYVEIPPLLENVAGRISATLHVPDIVILLREKSSFITRYSTRAGEPMNLESSGSLVKTLRDRNDALTVYLDKPPLWLGSLDAKELQAIDFMRTQLLLPISSNDRLTGIMSLGPKLSEQPYTESDIRLLQAVTSQMALAVENSRLVASLAAEAAAREIANRELEIAREVQERLFPQKYPAIDGLDCAGYCRPARGVGGDYYDFLQLESGRLGIAVGDVSGKGIAAALLMASLQASLRGQAAAGVRDLSSLMANVNKLVYEASTANRYATFFYGEFDPASKIFSFVNAGHNPPVILRGDQTLRLEADGPVVGLLPGANYGQSQCHLQCGDIFIAYTDGISEALNEKEEEWEEERFIAAARQCVTRPAKEMIQEIFRAADAFTGSARQYDDMTLLVMKLAV
ncbi:MAG TPA: SpoIIE family protein phosphatase [Bryobacteraceae bacterium]|nr:SpoIIE family protein phosphatase [Bryobacteraceae bacterium]